MFESLFIVRAVNDVWSGVCGIDVSDTCEGAARFIGGARTAAGCDIVPLVWNVVARGVCGSETAASLSSFVGVAARSDSVGS